MDKLTDREIYKASKAIDKELAKMTKENRGETAQIILKFVRDLNDHIADKVWKDIHPEQPMGLQKVASKLNGKYRFIARFDSFLRASVSHFTPSEDGSERLLIKYYKYLLQLKKMAFEKYNMLILENISCFVEDTDTQTREYYEKIADCIEKNPVSIKKKIFDNYYIEKIVPFYVHNNIYYEVTLQVANDKRNKFQRITAFTQYDIFDYYSVALSFSNETVSAFNVNFPIKIITDWHVSIRPCEIDNFAKIMDINMKTVRSHGDYKALMKFIENNGYTLVEIIDLSSKDFNKVIDTLDNATRRKYSMLGELLKVCRSISNNDEPGKNILRYLLLHLNNQIIKDQGPVIGKNTYADLKLSSKCRPFDEHPFCFNPKGHVTNLYDLYQCIDIEGRKSELLKRYIDNITYGEHKLFVPIDDLKMFGQKEDVLSLIEDYNESIFHGFRPRSELSVFENHVFVYEYEEDVYQIITKIKKLTTNPSEFIDEFSSKNVENLKKLPLDVPLEDPQKIQILTDMFSASKVQCIYGAAGTGKTTLVNYVCELLKDKKKIFLAKTHPAVENLKRKMTCKNADDKFWTIDTFKNKSLPEVLKYNLIVVDECSTVKNEDILTVLNKLQSASCILMGDIYQIESIGFGNWFSLIRNVLPDTVCHELITPFRSSDHYLKMLWDEVRNMTDDNVVLEKMVRSDYSHVIDDDIFEKKANDEIILCLNYDGLYGLNNINKLLQLNNPEKAVSIGIWQFKKGDPILFNDSKRFECLYNNLKGRITDIKDLGDSVYFEVEVEAVLNEFEVNFESGLEFIESNDNKTTVGMMVTRSKPYESDQDALEKTHVVPFQVAYAVSIHKAQGLEYESVKIVIADESEERISHNIFYTAITRAINHLTIYWSHEVCNRILARIRPINNKKDYYLLKSKRNI